MSAISWAAVETFASPASTSTASSGDDWIRSFMTAVARGLGESFYWPGSAVSAGSSAASGGELQLGSLRFAHASSVTSGFADGYLSLSTPYSGLYHIGSSWTGLLGHSLMLDAGSGSVTTFPTKWVMHEGRYVSSGTTTIVPFIPAVLGTFTYSAPPLVFLSEGTTAGGSGTQFFAYGVHSVSSVSFVSVESALNSGTAAPATYFWRSFGTVSDWTV